MNDELPSGRRFRAADSPRGPRARRGREPDAGPRGDRGHRHGGRGHGRPGGWQQADLPATADLTAWLTGRLPDEWFVGEPSVTVDREEIIVSGELPAPEPETAPGERTESSGATREAAALGRISRFREDTREVRMRIADEAEARYRRKLAWGASIGDTRVVFTHLAVPVMTRLRQNERRVLDTLVDAGVARSRSDALAWCVALVAEHTDAWLGDLREAMSAVDKLRAQGPEL